MLLQMCAGIVQCFDLRSKMLRCNFFHAQHEFTQTGADDFVAVVPKVVKNASTIRGVVFNVLAQVGHKVSTNNGERMIG